jgi:WD40 repeat protein
MLMLKYAAFVLAVMMCSTALAAGPATKPAPGGAVTQTEIGKLPDPLIKAGASPDGRHLAAVQGTPDNYVLLLDGKVLLKSQTQPGFTFSADGKRFGFWGSRGKNSAGAPVYFASVDGREILGATGVTFSPDSRRFGCGVHKGGAAMKGGPFVVCIDGRESPPFDTISGIRFSPDSRRVAYGALDRGWTLVIDGQKVGPTWKYIEDVTFSPDSRHLAYAAKTGPDGKLMCVVRDGVEGPKYKMLDQRSLVFSPDSRQLAYIAHSDKAVLLVTDTRQIVLNDNPEMFRLDPPVFSPDSRSIAYYKDKSAAVLKDGQEKVYDGVFMHRFVFSADSKRLAYLGHVDRDTAVFVDGNPGKAYKSIQQLSLCFSPDSKHLLHSANVGDKQCMVIDGEEGPAFDSLLQMGPAYCNFTPDGAVEYVGAKDGKVFRVRVPLK